MTYDSGDNFEKVSLKNEASLRLLIENLKDVALFTIDLENRCASWNSGAELILGYTEAEIIGQTASIIFTPEDRARGADVEELNTAQLYGRAEDERWHLRKDGSRFYGSGIMALLRDEKGTPYGYAKIMRDLTERKQAQEALEIANQLLEQRVAERTAQLMETDEARRELIRKLVTTQEAERTRIARELHDQTGHQLTTLIFELNNHKRLSLSPAAQESVNALIALSRSLMDELHTISYSLRPPLLDVFGLESTLQDYGEQWSVLSGIPIEVECRGLEKQRLSSEIEITIYRIVQESLTNVLRHAATATEVHILVQRQRQEVVVAIEDNGPGFDVPALLALPPQKRRLGLLGMQERALLLGGTLTVESTPGQGTRVRLQLPVTEG